MINMDTDIPNVKMDMSTMSDSEIVDLFQESYEASIASVHGISDYEVICDRQLGSKGAKILVNIVGFAGIPTSDEYCDLDAVKVVGIARSDKGRLSFHLDQSQKTSLGGIDYQMVYESE